MKRFITININVTDEEFWKLNTIKGIHGIDYILDFSGLHWENHITITEENLSKLLYFIDICKYNIPELKRKLQKCGDIGFGW